MPRSVKNFPDGGRGEGEDNNNKFDDTTNKGESSSDKVFGSLPAAGLTREEGQGVTPIPDPRQGSILTRRRAAAPTPVFLLTER